MRDREYEKTANSEDFVRYALSLTWDELTELRAELSKNLKSESEKKTSDMTLFSTAVPHN